MILFASPHRLKWVFLRMFWMLLLALVAPISQGEEHAYRTPGFGPLAVTDKTFALAVNEGTTAQAEQAVQVEQEDEQAPTTPQEAKRKKAADKKRGIDLPLDADKTLTLDLNEATWLSVDVDPDGSRLVMEVLGNLYLLPIEGGSAEPLSVGLQFDSQPKFSPDGKHIAFISDRDGGEELWLLELATGETRRLSKASSRTEFASPSWSPDGDQVIVSRTTFALRTFELWAYPVEGGTSGVQITKAKARSDTPNNARHNALGPVYDPTGRFVYYARKSGGFAYNQRVLQWQLARRDLQDAREDRITATVGSAFRPLLSPDGLQLVYGTRYENETGLRIRDLASGQDEWLAYPIQHDDQESRFTRDLLPGYAFTPDGKSVIASRDGKLIRVDTQTKAITPIPFDVRVQQPVVERLHYPWRTGLGPVKARILADAILSPDGERVAFTTFGRIHVHHFNSDQTFALSPADRLAAFPSWSSDGRHVLYVTTSPDGGHIIRQRARKGSRGVQITQTPAYYSYPVQSPDGKRVVALRESVHERRTAVGRVGPGPGAEVVWFPSRGGFAKVVSPARGYARPHFGPEDDRIYLQVLRANPGKIAAGLVSVRFDGTDSRSILTVEGPGIYNQDKDSGAQSMQISKDGRHVAFRHANQLYVTRLIPFLPAQKLKLNNPALPLVKLTDVGADSIGWNHDGSEVVWTVGNVVSRRAMASIDFLGEDEDDELAGKSATPPISQEPAEQTDTELETLAADEQQDTLREDHAAVDRHAIDVYLPRHAPEGVVAFVGATLLTMGPQGTIDDATVVIDADRIVAVGARDQVNVPAEARVFDVQGQYILPGYIDTHAHFRVSREISTQQSASFLANLAYGVTTGMDVQPNTVDLLAAQDRVDAGLLLGPRAFSTGPGVFSNNEFRSETHAKNVLRRYADHYRVRNLKAYISGSREQRHWLIGAARELRLMPTTEGALDMKLGLTHLVDGFSGHEHAFPLPTLYADVVALAAQTRIAYTPTLLVSYGGPSAENYFYTKQSPHDDAKLRRFTPYNQLASRTLRRSWFHGSQYVTQDIADGARQIVEAGGQVGLGAHGQLQGLGYHWELWAMASGGWAPMDVLRSATLMGAQMLGVDQDLGSIEVGKLGDLVVLEHNPLEDLSHTTSLKYVVKGGDVFEAQTLRQVWPQERELPQPWWQRVGPETLPTAEIQ